MLKSEGSGCSSSQVRLDQAYSITKWLVEENGQGSDELPLECRLLFVRWLVTYHFNTMNYPPPDPSGLTVRESFGK